MKSERRRKKILFVCTANSCRSQMAEAWARKLKNRRIEPYSAGVTPFSIDPLAVEVMAEVGIDIAGARSKHVNELRDISFDHVITVCDRAQGNCPAWLGAGKRHHFGFVDPGGQPSGSDSEEDVLASYRRVRDEIRVFIDSLPESLEQ